MEPGKALLQTRECSRPLLGSILWLSESLATVAFGELPRPRQ